MRNLEPWALAPGDYDGTLQEFVAGAAAVIECHVFTLVRQGRGRTTRYLASEALRAELRLRAETGATPPG
jgi:hypothetical protein